MTLKLLNRLVTGALLASLSPWVAAKMITPVGVQASSTFSSYTEKSLINGSGMMMSMAHDTDFNNMWMSQENQTHASLIFDLGKLIDLAGTYVWNYDANCCSSGRGVQSFNILTSKDGISFSSATNATLTKQGNGLDPITAEFIPFNQKARYVKFDIGNSFGASYVGLSEVKFEEGPPRIGFGNAPAVPEPYTIALLALSLLGMYSTRSYKR